MLGSEDSKCCRKQLGLCRPAFAAGTCSILVKSLKRLFMSFLQGVSFFLLRLKTFISRINFGKSNPHFDNVLAKL